jgi:hypothetical protein
MSRILNRPMFRGGGKVSSYGTGIASGLADGGMADKRGLVDGPGGYAGVGTTGGFGDSILARSGRYLKDYALNPFLNVINQDIANPLMGLAGYGDLIPRLETPYDDKYLLGLDENFKKIPVDEREKFSDRYLNDGLGPIETDSGAIPKESAKQAAMIEREKYNDLVKKQKEAMDKGPTKLTDEEKLAEVQKDQAFFEKLLGGGKEAKIQDASDMALSFAGKAFKEGATTKSAFGEFFEEESKRPSRRLKVKDAATQAAIQSYLTGKVSYQKFQDDLALTKAGLDMKAEAIRPKNLNQAFAKFIKTNDKATDPGIMSDAVEEIYGIDSFAGPLPEDTTKLIIGKVYYGDAQDKSSNKILYLIDETGTPNPIKTVYR